MGCIAPLVYNISIDVGSRCWCTFLQLKGKKFGKLMVNNIFLSGWKDSHSDWGNDLPKNRGRVKKGTCYHSNPKTYRNFWTQEGSGTLPPMAKSKVKPNHTPKIIKSKWWESVNLLSHLNVLNLPGKKKLCTEPTKSTSSISKMYHLWNYFPVKKFCSIRITDFH